MSVVLVPPAVASLEPLVDAGVLEAVDVHLAAWVARASGESSPEVSFAIAMASWAARHGHSCAALDDIAAVAQRAVALARDGEVPDIAWPAADDVVAALHAAPHIVRVVRTGHDGDATPVLDSRPLVLHGRRAYLQRHWVDECIVAAALRARAGAVDEPRSAAAAALLDELLPPGSEQRTAAEAVLGDRLAVVVGGPGTGKTYTVARLLAVLLEQARPLESVRIGLAAPTGKAAQRLRESILAAVDARGAAAAIPADVRAALAAVEPTTIHRLLGPLGQRRQRFRHDAESPLPHDVVVVDETSMVSVPLLARLVEAVRPEARLVLLGDPDQLESVELGAALGDLVAAAGRRSSPLAGRVVRLHQGHRFGAGSHIARVAEAVRAGDAGAAVAALRGPADLFGGVEFVECDDPLGAEAAVRAVIEPRLAAVRMAAEAGDAEAALEAAAAARMLCAHREGPFGVSAWNRFGERWMFGSGAAPSTWSPGRPVLVTRNDLRLGLANGDAGVVIRRDGRPVVAFPGHAEPFEPVALDAVDTAFAMTVHKSQGSEFPAVVFVLPPPGSPLAGRELLYTAVTRAKESLTVVGSVAAVEQCIATPARRMTGLADALRQA